MGHQLGRRHRLGALCRTRRGPLPGRQRLVGTAARPGILLPRRHGERRPAHRGPTGREHRDRRRARVGPGAGSAGRDGLDRLRQRGSAHPGPARPTCGPGIGPGCARPTAGELVIVTDRVALPVPAADATAVLRALRLDTVAPVDVPQSWSTFPAGPPLVPFGSTGPGRQPGHRFRTARVGSVLVVDEETPTPRRYLVTSPGRLGPESAGLRPTGLVPTRQRGRPPSRPRPSLPPTAVDPPVPIQWPAVLGPSLLTRPCAMLLGSAGGSRPPPGPGAGDVIAGPHRPGRWRRWSGLPLAGPPARCSSSTTPGRHTRSPRRTPRRWAGWAPRRTLPRSWSRDPALPTGPPPGITEAARPVVPVGRVHTADGSGDGEPAAARRQA